MPSTHLPQEEQDASVQDKPFICRHRAPATLGQEAPLPARMCCDTEESSPPTNSCLHPIDSCLGETTTQALDCLQSKVAQGGKHKDRHDVKIRQIWRESENSCSLFKHAQQDIMIMNKSFFR